MDRNLSRKFGWQKLWEPGQEGWSKENVATILLCWGYMKETWDWGCCVSAVTSSSRPCWGCTLNKSPSNKVDYNYNCDITKKIVTMWYEKKQSFGWLMTDRQSKVVELLLQQENEWCIEWCLVFIRVVHQNSFLIFSG